MKVLLGNAGPEQVPVYFDRSEKEGVIPKNIAVLGSACSGKTFLTKLLSLRLLPEGSRSFFIAPFFGYELSDYCENMDNLFLPFGEDTENVINFLEITFIEDDFLNNVSMLDKKIERIIPFFEMLMLKEKKYDNEALKKVLYEVYNKKGITSDNTTVIDGEFVKGTPPKMKEMPLFEDIYLELEKYKNTLGFEDLARELNTFVSGKLSFFNQQTNVSMSKDIVVFDLAQTKEFASLSAYIILDYLWDMIRANGDAKENIFFDCGWVFTSYEDSDYFVNLASMAFGEMPSYNGMSVFSTPVCDDSWEMKEILKNCEYKVALKMEENELLNFENILNSEGYQMKDSEKEIIRNLIPDGTCLVFDGKSSFLLKTNPTDEEKLLIEYKKPESDTIL